MQKTVNELKKEGYISLLDFVEINEVKNRRGHKMSFGYLYRLIRQHKTGTITRPLWFEYVFVGEKDRILIKSNHINHSDHFKNFM